jgi:hypothetical protein
MTKYPVGMSILSSPFFFAAHQYALHSGYPADGFSDPYQKIIGYGMMIFTIIGLIYLRRVLLKFLSDKTVALTLFFIVIGTNYFFMSSLESYSPHSVIFFLYSMIIWFTIRWHEDQKPIHALLIGLSCGLAIMSRMSEIVCLLIPLLWGVTGKQSFIEKLNFLRSKPTHVLLVGLGIIIFAIPQLVYWKFSTGKFLVYSYSNNPGEGFELLWPYTLKSLFSFRKGLLIYTPILILAIIGFVFMYKRKRSLFYPVFTFFVFNLYIVSSWSCWYFATSFGNRGYIQSYAVMAIPLGFFISEILSQRKALLKLVFIIPVLFLVLNLFQTWQYMHRVIDWSRMTAPYYFKVFGKTYAKPEWKELLLVDRSDDQTMGDELKYEKKNLATIGFEDVEENRQEYYIDSLRFSGNYSFILDSTCKFSPGLRLPYKEVTDHYYSWIKAGIWVYTDYDPKENPSFLVVTFQHKDKNYKYKTLPLESIEGFKIGEWNYIEMEYLTPEVRRKNNPLVVYYWLRGKNPVYVDELAIDAFTPKD